MGIFKSSKKVAGRIVDVRVDKWMSWDYISDTTERLRVTLLDIVIPKKATMSETFEEAMDRMELSENDLAQRKYEFTRLLYFFLCLSIVIIVYALYMAFNGSLATSLIAFCLAMYSLTQAFRFHFWLFQIKNRKLGCTLREWFDSKVIDEPGAGIVVAKPNDQTITPESKPAEKASKADE